MSDVEANDMLAIYRADVFRRADGSSWNRHVVDRPRRSGLHLAIRDAKTRDPQTHIW